MGVAKFTHHTVVVFYASGIVFLRRHSLLFDIILYSVQPSSLRYSSLPSPLYFHFHRPPSYAVFLSCHHMPIQLQPPFLDFLCDFPHFRCPPYSFISYLVQLCNSTHPSYYSLLRGLLYHKCSLKIDTNMIPVCTQINQCVCMHVFQFRCECEWMPFKWW